MRTPTKTQMSALWLLVALAGLTTQVWADFDAGWRAYERGDYATALREWLPLAQQGDADAQRNLGLMYEKGEGVPQDYAQAVQWYRWAAEQGHANAQFFLGRMYNKGEGVPQDYAQGVQWYRRAAEQGNADAQNNLGLMYDTGQGVPQDYQQAYFWYNLAAAHFSHQASREIAVRNRDSVAARLTPAQLAQAQAQARTWQPKPETPSTPSAPSPGLSVPAKKLGSESVPQTNEESKIFAGQTGCQARITRGPCLTMACSRQGKLETLGLGENP